MGTAAIISIVAPYAIKGACVLAGWLFMSKPGDKKKLKKAEATISDLAQKAISLQQELQKARAEKKG